ncbi:YbaN family protein [Psychrosphaera sp. 1_MG-2023]|uniref:YbaN family protein n=1 Tax=Psychrosphaera sp. 1_MG-2023 TaxID=3062643 RepID=UPI0026E11B14|nr:YbaN family protein [Psychrosphaera sp. 1_MG-2023]MDO6720662.1 YbaN family protein [Psychrosphaera sp. 1_MG-2023]
MTLSKLAYFALGWLCIILGTLGIILPLLPTTPFILVAAFAFSKSSERFHLWLLHHNVFGPLIQDWQTNGVIRLRVKWLATFSIVVMLSTSFYFIPVPTSVVVGICAAVGCVLVFIWSRPSLPK